ncbi:MAG: hypothetical protein LUH10_14645 [Tannerellaceae bacterium]|nr:hypothetical protein [Tannerellaceae bacterium]
MRLTSYCIKSKIKTLAKQAPCREHAYCGLGQAKDLLMVYSYKDKSIAEECMVRLRELDKNVHGCMYIPSGQAYETGTDDLQVKEETDTDLLMFPKTEVLKRFTDLPADILIDLSRPGDHVMKYMVLSHPALLKVGRKSQDQAFHDLSILMDEEGDVQGLFDHIIFYLQTIGCSK